MGLQDNFLWLRIFTLFFFLLVLFIYVKPFLFATKSWCPLKYNKSGSNVVGVSIGWNYKLLFPNTKLCDPDVFFRRFSPCFSKNNIFLTSAHLCKIQLFLLYDRNMIIGMLHLFVAHHTHLNWGFQERSTHSQLGVIQHLIVALLPGVVMEISATMYYQIMLKNVRLN